MGHGRLRVLAAGAVVLVSGLSLCAAPADAAGPVGGSSREASAFDCTVKAVVSWNRNANRYTYRGFGSCAKTRKMRIWCFPVHRHWNGISATWHSHTGYEIRQGPNVTRRVDTGGSTISGGNENTYKINCKLELDGRFWLRVKVETAPFHL
ncbi:hypothetical protein ACIBHY_28085 [Nonomuraea sp. NPDC050547]|uniref:hypothetical protein n=1 Tax=Nonomuraea sp. NPDC050547 TaxID=3364368 RepID=UPI00378D174C